MIKYENISKLMFNSPDRTAGKSERVTVNTRKMFRSWGQHFLNMLQ